MDDQPASSTLDYILIQDTSSPSPSPSTPNMNNRLIDDGPYLLQPKPSDREKVKTVMADVDKLGRMLDAISNQLTPEELVGLNTLRLAHVEQCAHTVLSSAFEMGFIDRSTVETAISPSETYQRTAINMLAKYSDGNPIPAPTPKPFIPKNWVWFFIDTIVLITLFNFIISSHLRFGL